MTQEVVRARVKPALITWARQSAGFSIAEASKRMAISEDRFEAWEQGDLAPTIGQLQELAAMCRRPLAVFYLQDVPVDFMPMRDFRRLPGKGLRRFSPALTLEIREAEQRRQLALELYEESGEEAPRLGLPAKLSDDPERIGDKIREALGVTVAQQRTWSADQQGYATFNGWRERIERRGVLVFQASDVEPDEVSGFAIAEEVVPAIVIGRKGASPTRRTFSLLHEFVHLMLGRTGVSDYEVNARRPPEDQRLEIFCNRAAAAALMPKDAFLSEAAVIAHPPKAKEWEDKVIASLARGYGVSREAIVRRLLTFKLTTDEFYRKKRAQYARERERRKQEGAATASDFRTNPPREILSDFGRPLVRLILGNYNQERMSLSEVAGYLGIRTRHIPTLERMIGGQAM